MQLKGEKVTLRPAAPGEKKLIYEWLAHSDLTGEMLGPPRFPDAPVPAWNDFDHDYGDYFFDGSQPQRGRCFIIEVNGNPVGQINYNEIEAATQSAELDIWMSGSENTGKGFGTDALLALCRFLNEQLHCKEFFIAPSRRNKRAVAAYQKAGFEQTEKIPAWFSPDYNDTLVMRKKIT